MRWDQLYVVLRKRALAYAIWLMANLGGLLVAYGAAVTIWIFHNDFGRFLPGPEVFLITGAISLSVAGVSYLSSSPLRATTMLPSLTLLWPFMLAAVYGVLIAMGMKTPVRGAWVILPTIALLSTGCLAWSSITWLHEQGIRMDLEISVEPEIPSEPPQSLRQAAADLPKIPSEPTTSEEEA